MGKYKVVFEIDGLPKMPNQLLGAHWRARSEQARKWKRLVWLMTVGKKPSAPLVTACITMTRYSSNEPDTDGLRGSFKPILDALVQCGILVNDKRENIGEPVCRWVKAAPKRGKISVTIEDSP